jgi:glutamate formiminotransferase
MRKLVECVPNFSEGRDRSKVEAIAGAIASAPGAAILDLELDADHNRSVITFAAPPESVVEARWNGIGKAVELIDLNHHTGVHPRLARRTWSRYPVVRGVDGGLRQARREAAARCGSASAPAYSL